MNARLTLACVLGFAGGAAAIPAAFGVAAGATPVPTPTQSHRGISSTLQARPGSQQPRVPAAPNPYRVYGATPATILAIVDNHCRSFDSTTPVDITAVRADDPRFQPCTPTANHFQIRWSSMPTQAQATAALRVLGDLAQNQPTITLDQATPLIRSAVASAK